MGGVVAFLFGDGVIRGGWRIAHEHEHAPYILHSLHFINRQADQGASFDLF